MKVRTYRGQEMGLLMSQIRDELGEEVMILSMREEGAWIEVEVGLEQHDPEMISLQHVIDEGHQIESLEGRRHLRSAIVPAEKKRMERALREVLSRQGVDSRFADLIVRSAAVDPTAPMSADRYIARGLESLLRFETLLPDTRRVVSLVGPTGAGKTTTIAKLAARLRQTFDLRIALISIDSYRVGAGYHLQTYASLMNMPFRMIDGSDGEPVSRGLARAAHAFREFDLVLIDTPGCGPRDSVKIAELAEDLSSVPECERMLVLPAPGNERDLFAAAGSFGGLGVSRVILSKLDESGFLGAALTTVMKIDKAVAFVTTGQRVPEDIEPATARRLGWMLTRTMH